MAHYRSYNKISIKNLANSDQPEIIFHLDDYEFISFIKIDPQSSSSALAILV